MLTRRIIGSTSKCFSRGVQTASDWVSLHGANGSPYTKKVQTALRYKRIPFTFHQLMPNNFNGDWEEKGFGHIKPKVCGLSSWENPLPFHRNKIKPCQFLFRLSLWSSTRMEVQPTTPRLSLKSWTFSTPLGQSSPLTQSWDFCRCCWRTCLMSGAPRSCLVRGGSRIWIRTGVEPGCSMIMSWGRDNPYTR